jgi:hypothetical protein
MMSQKTNVNFNIQKPCIWPLDTYVSGLVMFGGADVGTWTLRGTVRKMPSELRRAIV